MKLRRAGPSDADAIARLTDVAYSKWVPVIGRKPRPMSADYHHAVRHHWIDLHEIDGELAALIEMIPSDAYLLIESIAIAPAHQGKGLGGTLLDHAAGTARAGSLAELRLYTNAAFASNIAFYAMRGFTVSGREPLTDGGVLVHMSRRL